jgi:acyl carrier protein
LGGIIDRNQSLKGGCMNKDEIFKRTTEYLITQFKIPPEKISPQANLFKDLGMDSIDALDWFAAMESEIGLPIIENELKMIRTVQDVVEYVLRNLR